VLEEPTTQVTENCDNLVDDNGDGLIDCDDPQCAEACGSSGSCVDMDIGQVLGTYATNATIQGESKTQGSCGGSLGPELAVRWTAPQNGTYVIDITGGALATAVYVRDGSCDGPELACFGYSPTPQVTVALSAGQTVVIFIDSASQSSNPIFLSFTLASEAP